MSSHPRSGPHKVLLALYALFTLAAGARAIVQLTTQYDEAPVAYWLSLVAAVTYALGWYAIREASVGHTAFLVTARRMAPGHHALEKTRRPAPGAYGPDYSGPRPPGV